MWNLKPSIFLSVTESFQKTRPAFYIFLSAVLSHTDSTIENARNSEFIKREKKNLDAEAQIFHNPPF